jgi:hypothetical protein
VIIKICRCDHDVTETKLVALPKRGSQSNIRERKNKF